MLRFAEVFYTADHRDVLSRLNIMIESDDFILVTGPSGSGKSTFLKLCCNLISPTKGRIYYHERPIGSLEPTVYRRDVGYCFQEPYLFGDTVRANLAFPYILRNKPYDEDRIAFLLEQFALPLSLLDKSPVNLSGGEKQRLSLVRCLVFTPKILMLDEITAALDRENADKVIKVMQQLHEKGTTIVWAAHDLAGIDHLVNKQIDFPEGSCRLKGAVS